MASSTMINRMDCLADESAALRTHQTRGGIGRDAINRPHPMLPSDALLHHPAHAAAVVVTGVPIGGFGRLGDTGFRRDHQAGD
jgi:hypothetical protein